MANNIIRRVWNQNRMVNIEDLTGAAFQAESGGHTFEISGIDDTGAAVALSGTVAGVFRRPDNADIAITGSASDGVVSVTLSEDCYAVPGRFGLTIFVTSNSQKVAVYACVGTVAVSSTGNVAGDTPASVEDLIDDINAAIADLNSAIGQIPASYANVMAAIAPTYSGSALYPVGAYAWYNGSLYRCTTPITTAEAWTAAHWMAAVLGNDVCELKSELSLNVKDLITDEDNIGVLWKIKREIRENNLLRFSNVVETNGLKSTPLASNKFKISGTSSASTIIKQSDEINLDHTKTYTLIVFFGDSNIRGTRPSYLYYGATNQVKEDGVAVSFANNPTKSYSIKSFTPDSDYADVSFGTWYAASETPNAEEYVFLVEGEYTAETAFVDVPSFREVIGNVNLLNSLKGDITNDTKVVNEIGRSSSNIVDPDDIAENTAITINSSGKYTTSSNNDYNSVLDIPMTAGVTYTVMPVRAYQVMALDDTTVITYDNTNKTNPFTYTPTVDCLFSFSYYKTYTDAYISDNTSHPGYEPYGQLVLTPSFAKITNPLYGKTIYNFGDSVSNGEGTVNKKGPAELVAEQFGMVCTDYSVSGATITQETGANPRPCIQTQIANASATEPDFILLAGGINDLKFTTAGTAPAQPTSYLDFWQDYINGLDTSVFSGSFEKVIYTLINKYPHAQIIYLFEQKMFSHYNDGTQGLHDIAIAICQKWDVQVIDFWQDGGLNLAVKTYLVNYGSTTASHEFPVDGVWYDGTHPNEEGYRLFYVPKLARTLMARCPVY